VRREQNVQLWLMLGAGYLMAAKRRVHPGPPAAIRWRTR